LALTVSRPGAALAPSPAIRGTILATATVVSFAAVDGGYFPTSWRVGAVVLGGISCLLALLTPVRHTRMATALLALLAAFGVLSASSGLWSADAHASLLDLQRTLLYLVGLASFVLAGEGLVVGVVLGAATVGAWALAERVIDGATIDPWEGRLLTGPIGYANGLGALMAIGVAVSLALALRLRRPHAAAPLAVLVTALLLTNSRGAALAAIVGCIVAVAITARRRLVATAVVGACAALLAVTLVHTPVAAGDRARYWHSARTTIAAHPFGGTGAGTFGIVHREAPYARDAHSLYLQAFSELGPIGLALIIAIVTLPLAFAIKLNLAAPAAGLAVFALHAGIDWDWQLPAVTLPALALAATAVQKVTGECPTIYLGMDRGDPCQRDPSRSSEPTDRASGSEALAR
jgi:O-antigen ligase